jgi:hypothetical protein
VNVLIYRTVFGGEGCSRIQTPLQLMKDEKAIHLKRFSYKMIVEECTNMYTKNLIRCCILLLVPNTRVPKSQSVILCLLYWQLNVKKCQWNPLTDTTNLQVWQTDRQTDRLACWRLSRNKRWGSQPLLWVTCARLPIHQLQAYHNVNIDVCVVCGVDTKGGWLNAQSFVFLMREQM